MIKKLVLFSVAILSLLTIAACKENDELKLPDLAGKSKQEVVNIFSGLGLQVSIEDVPNVDIQEGYFVAYGEGFEVDQPIEPGTQVVVQFAEFANILPDLTGKTQSQIYSSFTKFPSLIVEIQTIETNEVDPGTFVSYDNELESGDIVADNTLVIIFVATELPESGLIISKYFEGSDDSKMIELYNTTDQTVDLSSFSLTIFNKVAGQTVTSSIPLTGNLEAHTTFIIVNPQSTSEMLLLADMESADLVYSGRQAIALTHKNGKHTDVFGDPTSGLLFSNDRTYVRHPHITQANETFDLKEWGIYAIDHYDMFGAHPVSYPETFTLEEAYKSLVFPEDLGGVVLVDFVDNNDGDTAEFTPGFLGGDRVRFVGIDTAETGSGTLAAQATVYVHNLLNSASEIYIQRDPTTGIRETYGRYLGLVWADDVLVNYMIVKMGYSQNNYSDPDQNLVFNGVSLDQWFKNAESYAQENNLGMWA